MDDAVLPMLVLWSILRWERKLGLVALERVGADQFEMARDLDRLLSAKVRENRVRFDRQRRALVLTNTGQYARTGTVPNRKDRSQLVLGGGLEEVKTMHKISLVIWLLILLAGGLVFVFITWPGTTKQFLGNEGELFKLTYQFLLITVIGGGVALVFKQLDQLRAMRQSLREMHAELLQAFNQAKTVRRHLRAQLGTVVVVNPNVYISAELYDDQMESLSDAQLTFEIHAKRAKDNSLWFWGNPRLANPLHKVEAYLNDIVKEYQKERASFSGTPPQRRVGDLPKLVEFIGPYDQAAAFKDQFKYPMRDALEALGKAVLR